MGTPVWGIHLRPWTWPIDILRLFYIYVRTYHGGDMHIIVVTPHVGNLLLLLLLLVEMTSVENI